MANPTIQSIVDDVRELLNDNDKEAWKDDKDMLPNVREALRGIRNVRPDAVIGQYATFEANTVVLGDLFPFDEQFITPFRDYLIFVCNRKEGEWTDRSHAGASYKFFKDYLL